MPKVLLPAHGRYCAGTETATRRCNVLLGDILSAIVDVFRQAPHIEARLGSFLRGILARPVFRHLYHSRHRLLQLTYVCIRHA